MKLAACAARLPLEGKESSFFCAHPRVHAPQQMVTAEVCRNCQVCRQPLSEPLRPFLAPRSQPTAPCLHLGPQFGLRDCLTCSGSVRLKVFACHHPLHRETTLDECHLCQDFEELPAPAAPRAWAVGVTTAPRGHSTLGRSLASLQQAGWPTARLFCEPGSIIPTAWADHPQTHRDETLGVVRNFLLAVCEMVQREPSADAYLMLQDDVVFCRDARSFLESSPWPLPPPEAPPVGLISLYRSSHYPARGGPVWDVLEAGEPLLGAVALVLPSAAARLLAAAAPALAKRIQHDPLAGHLDLLLANWARHARLSVAIHAPSLAQHIGATSVVWPGAGCTGERRAEDFPGEAWNAASWLKTPAAGAATRVSEAVEAR